MLYLCNMKMKIRNINGNLTDSTATFIAHCVNCQGKMNSGVARAIRNKWPKVFEKYRAYWEKHLHPMYGKTFDTSKFLGTVLPVVVNEKQTVLNVFGQNFYGYDGKQYVDYSAIRTAFSKIAKHLNEYTENDENISLAIPYKMCCGLAGGNWSTIYDIIVDELGDISFTLEIWDINNNDSNHGLLQNC